MSGYRPAAFDLPRALLREAKNQIVSVETKNGMEYRGRLDNVSSRMNLVLSAVTVLNATGERTQKNRVLVRGDSIVLVVLPEALEDAPQLDVLLQVKQARKAAMHVNNTDRKSRGARRSEADVHERSGASTLPLPQSESQPQLKRTRVFLSGNAETVQRTKEGGDSNRRNV
ncbi:Sm protein D3 [Cyanidioschyzon merolae strain 10D]|uniref:Sm protein D3 n=1 Tax=Cyanidioschyzon merolae (strain NIES-3377 / 10D) TaxID=280699 RepID=M1VIK0_CYAM1|nr:Sm protein D3 [Cyanidioschyzon merolae strain 10D]BAM80948.1 Sm protein D3 [Cyanidioschyzon merolae strain 10D]|eukprot:XP_005536984.1 Sm protein D3 [Cyanidioschyzon merolae strain 10D]